MIQMQTFSWDSSDRTKALRKGIENVDNGYTRMHHLLNRVGKDRIIQITTMDWMGPYYTVIYEDGGIAPTE